jgi:two-component system response regulator PilR (NtrC family)
MRLPDGNGIDLVREISRDHPELPVAVITAYGNTESAVEALKSGAFDFVSKPVDLEVLRNLVNSALKLSPEISPGEGTPTLQLLGRSAAMRDIRETIAKLARSQAPVYISGESGVGKELAAKLIHDQGPRCDGPFVPVNCGAIPTELMESEFFGHRKGSFTGAHADKDGLFQAANGGTLFLDEVAELPIHMQVKLLRAIQEKAVRPIGARDEVSLDVRILSATHKELAACVERGEFRQDLYYRINVIELHMPSLRERPEDIPELARHVLGRIAPAWGIDTPTLSEESLEQLRQYPFPGNVRELENILERALTLCEGEVIEPSHLQLRQTAINTGEQPTVADRGGMPLEDYIESIERDAILKALEETRYNKTAAARKLGITFRALRYRLKKLGLE